MMTTKTEPAAPVANDESQHDSDPPDVNGTTAIETVPEPTAEETPTQATESTPSHSEDEQEIEAGATDAAPNQAVPATTTAAPNAPSPGHPTRDEDRRSELEKQPYDFEKCTVQIAIQLLPKDSGAPSAPSAQQIINTECPQGRRVLIGVRTHLDAPIIRMLSAEELGELPPAIVALLEQLKSELPAREQAARKQLEAERERREKEKQARAPKHTRASPAKEAKARRAAETAKPKTVQAATAPAPSVLTAEQRENAVNKTNDDKQQLALF